MCDVGSVEVVPSGPQADVSVNKTDSPDPVLVGNDLTYTVTVTDNGPLDAESVTMVDTLPSEVTFKSVSTTGGACSEADGTVTCALDTVDNGATITVTIVVTTNSVGTVRNSATATSQTPDPNISNNTDSTTTTVNPIPSGGVGTGSGGASGGQTPWALFAALGFLVAAAGLALRRAGKA